MNKSKVTTGSRLIWHRRDLRLHDNPLYWCNDDDDDKSDCPSNCDSNQNDSATPPPALRIVPVCIFDTACYAPRPSTCRPRTWTAVTTGPWAARCQVMAVTDLRRALRQRYGCDLIVRHGPVVECLTELIRVFQPTEVAWHDEIGHDEGHTSHAVATALQNAYPHVRLRILPCTYTLYHPNDLPRGAAAWKRVRQGQKMTTPITERAQSSSSSSSSHPHDDHHDRWEGLPRLLGHFRTAVASCRIRPTRPAPSFLESPLDPVDCDTIVAPGEIPSLTDLYAPLLDYLGQTNARPLLGLDVSTVSEVVRLASEVDHQPHLAWGEAMALAHLQGLEMAADQWEVSSHDQNRSEDPQLHSSLRLSHYLAWGCLSPRLVAEVAGRHGPSLAWWMTHLAMRDFFLYTCLASGTQFYQRAGIPISPKHSARLQWKAWDTPTAQDHWRKWALGKTGLPLVDAALTELYQTGFCANRVRQNAASVLCKDLGIDWRAGAEWFQFLLQDHCVGCNWGNWMYFAGVGSDPKHRHFRTISQALKYDPDGAYVQTWLPELSKLKKEDSYLRPWDFGGHSPVVPPETQYTWRDLQRLRETGSLKTT